MPVEIRVTHHRETAELRSAWTGEDVRPYTIKTNGGGQECPPYTTNLDIQILHVQGVVFYEFSAGFHVFAH